MYKDETIKFLSESKEAEIQEKRLRNITVITNLEGRTHIAIYHHKGDNITYCGAFVKH